MENIEKFHPLLSKCNDAIVVERSVQDILKDSLFSTSEVEFFYLNETDL